MERNKQSSFPITLLKEGDKAIVDYIQGGQHARTKLTNMGVIPGQQITINCGGSGGPSVIRINNTKIMIGRGMLHKIYVHT